MLTEAEVKMILASRDHWYKMYVEALDAYQKQVHRIEELEREVRRLGRGVRYSTEELAPGSD